MCASVEISEGAPISRATWVFDETASQTFVSVHMEDKSWLCVPKGLLGWVFMVSLSSPSQLIPVLGLLQLVWKEAAQCGDDTGIRDIKTPHLQKRPPILALDISGPAMPRRPTWKEVPGIPEDAQHAFWALHMWARCNWSRSPGLYR